jgi:hypothetical protein
MKDDGHFVRCEPNGYELRDEIEELRQRIVILEATRRTEGMIIEDTAGNKLYWPEICPNCDCGQTGGCPKCRPVYVPKTTFYPVVSPVIVPEESNPQ